jgi:hypothetical protein
VTRGEPRCVHPRRPRCRFLSLARACPTSMPARMRHHRTVLPPMCSDDQRARVRGPSEGCVCQRTSSVLAIALATGACALKGRMPTTFPSSAPSGHPLSPVRAPTREETPAGDVDRPRLAFHRHPAKGTGIPRTGMPSDRHAPPSVHRIAPARGTKTTSRSRRPTRFPQAGER